MTFQDDPSIIRWKIHLKSPLQSVYKNSLPMKDAPLSGLNPLLNKMGSSISYFPTRPNGKEESSRKILRTFIKWNIMVVVSPPSSYILMAQAAQT